MRFTTALLAILLLFTPVCWSQTTAPSVALKMDAGGNFGVTIAGKVVLNGHWQPIHFDFQGLDADQAVFGPIVSTTVATESPTHFIVTDNYAAAKATTDITLDGEDLHLAQHLENRDPAKSLKKVAYVGTTAHFSKIATGTLTSLHWSYLVAKGVSLYHPSLLEPIGAVTAHDDQFGFAISSASEIGRESMFNAEFEKDGIIPADCRLQFFTNRTVQPGQAMDIDVTIRISTDTSTKHLLGAYKKSYDQHFPTLLYHPDNRALAAFTGVGDQKTVTKSNPYGFIGAIRRLDSEVGTAAYVRLVAPPLHNADALGIIFWSPGGFRPPMYPPDFDVFPDEVTKNLPALVKGFNSRGLRVGLCARCGEMAVREPGKEPYTVRLSATNADEMKTLVGRFQHAIDLGFDMFYLDTFGNDGLNDLGILRQIRSAVGPDVLFYTEYCTDESLPYAGRYCEWQGSSVTWTSPAQYEALRYICPDSTWICTAKTGNPIPREFAKLGLTPLVVDMESNRLPAAKAK